MALIQTTYSMHQCFPRRRELRLQNNVRLRKRVLIFLKKYTKLLAEIFSPRRAQGPSHFYRREVAVNVFNRESRRAMDYPSDRQSGAVRPTEPRIESGPQESSEELHPQDNSQ